MKTYKDVAATTLREFAEGEGVYVSTATAEAAFAAIVDALVQAGADPEMVESFLDSEVEEYVSVEDTWGTRAGDALIATAKKQELTAAVEALLKVVESL